MHVVADLEVGGLQRVVEMLCSLSDRTRFSPQVICLNRIGDIGDAVVRAGVSVELLSGPKDEPDRLAPIRLARVLRRERPAIVHTHNTQAMLEGVLAARLARVKRVIHTDHGRLYPDRRSYVLAERLMSHLTDAVVGVSERTRDQLRTHQRIADRRLHVIPNGVDASEYEVKRDPQRLRSELGLSPTAPVIGIAARLVIEKGLTYLLKAMPLLLREYPSICAVVAGEGKLEHSLRAEADSLGISSNVRFVGLRNDIPALTQMLDVYVLPSISEGLPMALLEAMAAARPIVATAVGGIPEAVTHGETGILVPPADPSAFASAVIELLRNPAKMRSLGAAGRARFLERYHARAMVRAYEDLYSNV